MLTALDSPAFLDRLLRAATGTVSPDEKAISSKIRAIDERREELADDWAAGELTRKEWAVARRALDDQLAKLTWLRHPALTDLTTREWDLLTTALTGPAGQLREASLARLRGYQPSERRGPWPAVI